MYHTDDVITLKKTHPCGGNSWRIIRVGADVKLQCQTCGRFLTLTRGDLQKRVVPVVINKENQDDANA